MELSRRAAVVAAATRDTTAGLRWVIAPVVPLTPDLPGVPFSVQAQEYAIAQAQSTASRATPVPYAIQPFDVRQLRSTRILRVSNSRIAINSHSPFTILDLCFDSNQESFCRSQIATTQRWYYHMLQMMMGLQCFNMCFRMSYLKCLIFRETDFRKETSETVAEAAAA